MFSMKPGNSSFLPCCPSKLVLPLSIQAIDDKKRASARARHLRRKIAASFIKVDASAHPRVQLRIGGIRPAPRSMLNDCPAWRCNQRFALP